MSREQRMDGWAIKDGEGNFIGIDESSGGYPYVPTGNVLRSIHVFASEEKALAYRDIFVGSGKMSGGASLASRWKPVRVILIEV